MKIIQPDACIIKQDDPIKLIERVGRLCYKTEDKIDENSCYEFLFNLINRRHYAMLEHGHIHFKVYVAFESNLPDSLTSIPYLIYTRLNDSEYLITVSLSHLFQYLVNSCSSNDPMVLMFNGMLKAYPNIQGYGRGFGQIPVRNTHPVIRADIISDHLLVDLLHTNQITQSEFNKHFFLSIKFICDRGVSHELVRHRLSVAQESTRYYNYSKEKFGCGIAFIEPQNILDNESAYAIWKSQCESAEKSYLDILKLGFAPQDARSVLPNSLKTELILTTNVEQWYHFFDLRYHGTTGAPHPDMKHVAGIAYPKFISYLTDISCRIR